MAETMKAGQWKADDVMLDTHLEQTRNATTSDIRRRALYEAQRRSRLYRKLLEALQQIIDDPEVRAAMTSKQVEDARAAVAEARGR